MIALLNLRLNGRQQLTNRAPIRRVLSTVELKKYYSILNVTKNSTTKEIKDSFLRLSKIYHPDNKTTGSHLKFVQLKEAYDAIKDGQPATTSGPYSSTSASSYSPFTEKQATPNSYSDYDFYSDLRYQSKTRARQRAYKMGYNFGGPYANSSTPWEDLRRDQEYRRRQQNSNSRSKPLEARRRRKEFEARQISYRSAEVANSKAEQPIVSGSTEIDNRLEPEHDTIITSIPSDPTTQAVEPPRSLNT